MSNTKPRVALGKIVLDERDPLSYPPSAIIAGNLGLGKSGAVGSAFPDYLALQTNPVAFAGLADLIRIQRAKAGSEKAAEIYKLPDRKTVPIEFNPDGEQKAGVWKWTKQMLWLWCEESRAGRNPYAGLIIDEFSTLLDWMFREIKAKYGKGDPDRMSFAAIGEVKEFCLWLTKIPQATGKGLICVSHWAEKQVHEIGALGPGQRSPKFGMLKYPAGPAFPIGTMIREVCKEFDLVWKLELDGTDRYFRCQPESDEEVIKTRRFGAGENADTNPISRVPVSDFRKAMRELGWAA